MYVHRKYVPLDVFGSFLHTISQRGTVLVGSNLWLPLKLWFPVDKLLFYFFFSFPSFLFSKYLREDVGGPRICAELRAFDRRLQVEGCPRNLA